MLNQSDLLDMYSLASPRECRQYTVFTKKTIDSFFKKLDLYPRLGEDGRFYFQKLQTIQRLPGDFAAKQQKTCLEISRFFIRILHIFASLSLTVIDIEIPSSDMVYSNKNKNGTRFVREDKVLSLPFLRNRPPQRGGVLQQSMSKYYIQNPSYKILNDYLEFYTGSVNYILSGTDVRIPIASVNPFRPEPRLFFSGKNYNNKTVEIIARLKMELDMSASNALTVKLEIIKPDKVPSPSPVEFRADDPYLPPKYNNQTLPKWIVNEFNKILGWDENNQRNVTRKRTRGQIPENIQPGFKVKGLMDALAQPVPVKAYCVARAMQLLSPQSMYETQRGVPASTQICDKGFSLLGKGSLPKSGSSITTSSSIMSLNLLFYDFLENTTPIISKETRPKYEEFVKTMRAVYQEETEKKNTNIDMNKITNAMNPSLCKNEGKMYLEDDEAIASLRLSIAKLLATQMEHTSKVMAILKKLFIITPSKPFLLQPAIEKGGIEAVEDVAAEARELLINYYSRCEITYREAVQDLKERVEANPLIIKKA